MTRSVAIIGGGIAGLAAAYELTLAQQKHPSLSFMLFEASPRLGGIVETHREGGFVCECGPDGWVSEKPWARELAIELGLEDELISSNDAERITYVLHGGRLVPMPRAMRMMVPEHLDTLADSALFSPAARQAYADEVRRAEELKRTAPENDESVASFVERHFGAEVLRVVGAPLLGGVFGGDVHHLSVRAVMQPFVQMEREYGSLIVALQTRAAARKREGHAAQPIFTSLRSGTGTLAERLAQKLPRTAVRLIERVVSVAHGPQGWLVFAQNASGKVQSHLANTLLMAAPPYEAAKLLRPVEPRIAELCRMPASSAVIAGFGFAPGAAPVLPPGFGYLAPEGEGSRLLAATFSDQKFAGRAPEGGKQVRAYFGGAHADRLMSESDRAIANHALWELERVLGPLPLAAVTVVRRWPHALPQYEVGHLERMAEMQALVHARGDLHMLGNGYRGVGLPDLIRDARAAARAAAQG